MPTREQMNRLVQAHESLPERMETAIWIRQNENLNEAWLVEIIPELTTIDRPSEPVSFNPGRDFPFPLHLIACNRDDFEKAVLEDRALADWVARGVVLSGLEEGRQLQELAKGPVHA